MNRSKQYLFRFNGGEKEKKKSISTRIDAANVTFQSMDSLFNKHHCQTASIISHSSSSSSLTTRLWPRENSRRVTHVDESPGARWTWCEMQIVSARMPTKFDLSFSPNEVKHHRRIEMRLFTVKEKKRISVVQGSDRYRTGVWARWFGRMQAEIRIQMGIDCCFLGACLSPIIFCLVSSSFA